MPVFVSCHINMHVIWLKEAGHGMTIIKQSVLYRYISLFNYKETKNKFYKSGVHITCATII